MLGDPTYDSDEQRWEAVRNCDRRADGKFWYVVRTTGIYSRPSCGVRPARRHNVMFFSSVTEARAAGYRPCIRCRPDERVQNERHARAVSRACDLLDSAEDAPSLDELARLAGYSRFHFHRVFKCFTGLTPHAYLAASRAHRVRRELARARTVSEAIYGSGFNSNGHFYATVAEILGMTPTSFRAGGRGTQIAMAVTRCSLGWVLVATTERGVCAVLVERNGDGLSERLRAMFPHAVITAAGPALRSTVRSAVHHAEPPHLSHALTGEVRVAVFVERVRQAMRAAADPVDYCDALAG